MINETPYAETEVLLALLNDDEARAREILLECYPNELDRLDEIAKKLSEMARSSARIVRSR